MTQAEITPPKIASREEWLSAQKELLKKWEEPKGRATGLGAEAGSDRILYPDEY